VLSTLHTFYGWVKKRYGIAIPDFPKIKVNLGWRNTVDKSTQLQILDEIRRISWDINPKIWIGCKWLATYYEIRPIELIHIKEKDFKYDTGTVAVRYTKTDDPKIIYFLPEDMELAKSFGPAFPNLYFFRHIKGNAAAKPGSQFGRNYLYKWWKKACRNLGIEGVDLYGGCCHSTVRYLAKKYSPEQIKEGGWKTSKAFDRYLGPAEQERKRKIYEEAIGPSLAHISPNSKAITR
jgi:integrase